MSSTNSDIDQNSSSHDFGDHLEARIISTISPDDYVLLMHFLDNVFPLQYPMYNPGVSEGGRGWLLLLLLQARPLYHAALAVSACHRRSVLHAKVGHSHQVAVSVQQRHSDFCVKLAQQSEQINFPGNGSGMVAALVQLVFLEVLLVSMNFDISLF